METVEQLIAQAIAWGKPFVTNNWSIIVGVIAALVGYKLLKVSVAIITTILVVALAITVGTHLGVIPPLDQMFGQIKNLIG